MKEKVNAVATKILIFLADHRGFRWFLIGALAGLLLAALF